MDDWNLKLKITGPTGSKCEVTGYISEAAKDHIVKVLADDFNDTLVDARLIDAAPMLLEACAALVAWCDENPPAGEALYFVNQARNAIAQANGRR